MEGKLANNVQTQSLSMIHVMLYSYCVSKLTKNVSEIVNYYDDCERGNPARLGSPFD